MKRKLSLACGVLGSVLFIATDVIGARRYPGYSLRDQVFSELPAPGSPVRRFMVWANCLPYAALMTVFGLGVRATRPEPAGHRTGSLLIVYGLTNAIGGIIFPMATRQTIEARTATVANIMHTPVMLAMTGVLVMAVRSARTLVGRDTRAVTNATIAALVVPGVVTAPYAVRVHHGQSTPWMGAIERVNIAATALWISGLAIALLRDPAMRASGQTSD